MPTNIQALFAMLEARQLRYVVVGGLALVLHGVDRLTADVDLAVDLAPAAAARLVDALEEGGYRATAPVDARQLADPVIRAAWHRDRNMQVFSYWDTTGRRPTIDICI
ncbi:MAG: nucleotidyltransferase domain-containing protein [Steroidobacteraceae bacterium]